MRSHDSSVEMNSNPPNRDAQSLESVTATDHEQDSDPVFSGFWKRVAASLIDAPILLIAGALAGGLLGVVYALYTGTAQGAQLAGRVGGVLAAWLYFAGFESSSQQATPGKLALGMTVTDLTGNRIGFGQATGRHFGKIVSTLTLFVGHMMAGWTEKKQALHDMMAGCLVVHENPSTQ